MTSFALVGARIFDGRDWHGEHALLVRAGKVAGIVREDAVPDGLDRRDAAGAMVVPGFIDLQVNGGGGVMFDGRSGLAGIETMCRAHASCGTTGLLPTLITDTPEATAAALAAGAAAARAGLPGFLGLHLEGPHLSLARKGAHDPALIRPMEDADVARIVAARRDLPALLVTLAPESVSLDQVRALAGAGVRVSLGHSDTDCATALAYAEAGATMVTHLFNAMSGFGHRAPGLVGAALESGALAAGLIADGIHVDPVAVRVALRAKAGPGRIFVVSDAMASAGTDLAAFTLNGRTITRRDGRLTLADGTLAGADIDMAASVASLHRRMGVSLDEALRMASLYPAAAIGLDDAKGALAAGRDADFVELTDELAVAATWIGGSPAYRADR